MKPLSVFVNSKKCIILTGFDSLGMILVKFVEEREKGCRSMFTNMPL